MRRVNKDFVTPPPKLISANCLKKIRDAINSPLDHEFSSYYYRDACISELELIYQSKCAFCETDVLAGASFRVDHFRPKCKVQEDLDSDGYYWLGYEWSNLILICEKCNLSKSNKFPVRGTRIYRPRLLEGDIVDDSCRLVNGEMLIGEGPILLNPEMDDVDLHFSFETDGSISGLTDRGVQTIQICNLNREALTLDRKKTIDGLLNDLRRMLFEFHQAGSFEVVRLSFKLFFEKLERLKVVGMKYSLLGQNLNDNFPHFFINIFSPKQQRVVNEVYEMYLDGNL